MQNTQNTQIVEELNTFGDGGEVIQIVADEAAEVASGFFSNLVEESLNLLGGIFEGTDDAPGLAIAAVIGAGILLVLAVAGIIWLIVKLVKKKK